MGTGRFGHNATLWGAVNKPDSQEVWLKDIFKCVGRLAEQRRHRGHADWSPVELFDHDGEELPIGCVKARLIDLQALQCLCRRLNGDVGGSGDLDLIAHAAQESIRDAWRAATARRNQRSGISGNLDPEDAGGASNDCSEIRVVVEVEALHSTETITERRREHADACRGADEREWGNVESQRLRRAAIADDDVNGAIFHCGIEHLLNRSTETMNLVDEEHLSRREVGEDRRHLPAMLNGRP